MAEFRLLNLALVDCARRLVRKETGVQGEWKVAS
jgi:hypothetical protein